MRVRIDVTKKDIKEGQVFKSDNCPIALAVSSQVRKGVNVCVSQDYVNFYEHNSDETNNIGKIPMPKKVTLFIDDFDYGIKVEPFSFNLNIPKKLLKNSLQKSK